MPQELKSFADFAQESGANLEGEKRPMNEIVNQPIVVNAYRILASKVSPGKQCLQLQFYYQNDASARKYIVFTTSEVLLRQSQQYAEHMPFKTVVRHNRYYTFS